MDTRDILFQEELLEHLFEGAYLVSKEREIILWNREAERLTGYSREEVIGHSCSANFMVHVDIGGRPLCRKGCPLQRTFASGKLVEEELFLRHKAGHRIAVLMRTLPLRNAHGETIGAIEMFRDNFVTESAADKIAELERLALMDHLTQIPNRRYLEMNLDLRFNELQRLGRSFGVLILDIDHFKEVNDTHGDDMGDEVLQMVARTLTHCSRDMDQVGRWGGEEFLVIVSLADHDQLEVIAKRFRIMVQRSELSRPAASIKVTVSVGGAVVNPGEDLAQLVKRADAQLYRAKQNGRNRVCIAAD